jgi:hypothetical protein
MSRNEESAANREMAFLLRAVAAVTASPHGAPAKPALLNEALSRTPDTAVPPPHRDALHRATVGAAARAVHLERELQQIHRLFAAAGIPFLLLKGPALAHTVYPLPDLRPYDDLDLLLRPGDVVRAAAALVAAGYRPLRPMGNADIRHQVRAGWDYGLQAPRQGVMVELCTGVAPRFFAHPPPEDLWGRAAGVDIAGAAISMPGAADLLVLLAVHGAKHLWSRLIWVADVARLLDSHGADDLVGRALPLARRTGLERMLELALALAGDLAGRPFSGGGKDRAVIRLAECVRSRWNAGVCTEPSGSDERAFHLRARERLRDRLRYVALLGLTPSHSDRRWLPLPDPLRGLHYVLRPVRLTLSAVTRCLGSQPPQDGTRQ